FIPLIGIGPLAIFLGMLRYGAPTRPVLAGAVAGLLEALRDADVRPLLSKVSAPTMVLHCTADRAVRMEAGR
ncbi:NrsF family protein, partial [Mesorhizobium sp. M1C.F.Ca.ET.144.01.1.1]|uniref:alpha/beta fold hydrolase n=1 Tax=Mesorhizobium sp. M1C.F.Ca.ET.144.01.1.1 TaxID=2563921 RepID=UPI001FDEBB91